MQSQMPLRMEDLEDIESPNGLLCKPIYRHKTSGHILLNLTGADFVRQGYYDKFMAREDDVYVVTFPKSGTTWTQELVYLISSNLDFETAKSKTIVERVPQLEHMEPPYSISPKDKENRPSPRLFKSHFPIYHLPPSILDKKAKIVYTIRNPKDILISLYKFNMGHDGFYVVDFDLFADNFLEDRNYTCPYWKAVLDAWERRHEENILVLFYEHMKKDLPKAVRQIAQFLGKSLTEDQVNKVVDHCSFSSMKNNPMVNYEFGKTADSIIKSDFVFMRKGEVGDWKNHFTREIDEKFNNYIAKHFGNSTLKFEYE